MTAATAVAARTRPRRIPRRRLRGPRLLLLVYVASLLLLVLAGAALAWLVSQHLTAAAVNSGLASDAAVIERFVTEELRASDLVAERGTRKRTLALEERLRAVARAHGMEVITVYAPNGDVLFSGRGSVTGSDVDSSARFASARDGRPSASIDELDSQQTAVLREYLPAMLNGEVRAIFEIERDAAPLVAQLDLTIRDIVVVMVMAGGTLSVFLFLVFRAAQNRLDRQTAALVDATRRDPLTGLLNHGAAVALLAERIEAAHRDGSGVAVSLVDIDNFRLLNDVHGHEAGDRTLGEVAALLVEELSDDATVGRYGPDEFVALAPALTADALQVRIERLRARLADLALQFGSSQRLPITISAGIASYPAHARAATELLSAATLTLREAKGGGGDRVMVAATTFEEQRTAELGSFQVLHSLVIAIDTKDRYTKRHSDDVARYSVFLGERLGLAADVIDTLRVAGQLHDVGKIGVPESVLRKPDDLTEEELAAMRQHVALGDLLVRDLPNIEVVRSGVRHHHERWDGAGYLDGLAGNAIPLAGRILSVGDVFSAMTTSRPYRKALSVEEALQRLRAAAGTQLDPVLSQLFADAMETDPAAPLPASDQIIVPGWGPGTAAA